MPVTRAQIIRRGLKNQCPNCGRPTLFPSGSLHIRRRCPVCGTGFDRGEGFFLGPLVLNYTAAVVVFVLPAIIAGVRGAIPWIATWIVAGIGCFVMPLALYRASWSWWLMLYFYFLPQYLPANGGAVGAAEEN